MCEFITLFLSKTFTPMLYCTYFEFLLHSTYLEVVERAFRSSRVYINQGEEENDLHPADIMEQNHNDVEGEGEEEEAEEPQGEEQPRGIKRQLIDVKMEPTGSGGGGVR